MAAKMKSLPVELSELLRLATRENPAALVNSLHCNPAVIFRQRQHPRRAHEMYHSPPSAGNRTAAQNVNVRNELQRNHGTSIRVSSNAATAAGCGAAACATRAMSGASMSRSSERTF